MNRYILFIGLLGPLHAFAAPEDNQARIATVADHRQQQDGGGERMDGGASLEISGSKEGADTTFKPGKIWPDDKGVHINAHGAV